MPILLAMRVTTWGEYGLIVSIHLARRAGQGPVPARDPGAVTVRDVMEASERGTFEVNCDHRPLDTLRCGPGSACAIRPVWRLLEQRINEVLDGITLAELQGDEAHVQQLRS